MNLRSFSLCSDYSYPLTLSIVGEPSWSWISRGHIQAQIEKKIRRCLFTSSIKREMRHFHVVVVQKLERNVQKVWCTCEVVVLLIKPIVFLTFLLSSASLDLKVPNFVCGAANFLFVVTRGSYSSLGYPTWAHQPSPFPLPLSTHATHPTSHFRKGLSFAG